MLTSPSTTDERVPLASPTALARWFPGVAVDDAKLVEALNEASDRFRGAVRHYVSRHSALVHLDGHGSRYMNLPSIEIDTASVQCWVGDVANVVDVATSPAGIIMRTDGAVFPNGLGNVTVAYDAGFDDAQIPAEIQAVVIDQARVLYSIQRGITWQAVGGMSLSFNATDSTGVTQSWTDVVEFYRIRRADRA